MSSINTVRIFIILIILSSKFLDSVECHNYAVSSASLHKLVEHEHKSVVKVLATYKFFIQQYLNTLNSYLNDFGSSQLEGLEEPIHLGNMSYIHGSLLAEQVVKHPFASYRVIRRLTDYLVRLSSGLTSLKNSNFDIMKKLVTSKRSLEYPTGEDFEMAASGVIRLKQLYQMDVNDMASGLLVESGTNSGLSARNCMQLGIYAFQNNWYSHAIDFFDKAIAMSENAEAPSSYSILNADEIRDTKIQLDEMILKHDEGIGQRFKTQDIQQDSMPFMFSSSLKNRHSPSFRLRKHVGFTHVTDTESKRYFSYIARYEDLCRYGTTTLVANQNYTKKANMKCYLDSTKHAYWTLSPLRIEFLHKDPLILQIYNVMSDREMNEIKLAVGTNMRQSITIAVAKGKQEPHTSRYRTSSTGAIQDFHHEAFKYINARVESMVGLKVTTVSSAEHLQVANYASGAHYVQHTDALHEPELLSQLPAEELKRGDRIATFMIYLSDVERGGSTVFPLLGVTAQPVKGSAVFWFNLHTNGSISRESLHAGCPVLYGNKWS